MGMGVPSTNKAALILNSDKFHTKQCNLGFLVTNSMFRFSCEIKISCFLNMSYLIYTQYTDTYGCISPVSKDILELP